MDSVCQMYQIRPSMSCWAAIGMVISVSRLMAQNSRSWDLNTVGRSGWRDLVRQDYPVACFVSRFNSIWFPAWSPLFIQDQVVEAEAKREFFGLVEWVNTTSFLRCVSSLVISESLQNTFLTIINGLCQETTHQGPLIISACKHGETHGKLGEWQSHLKQKRHWGQVRDRPLFYIQPHCLWQICLFRRIWIRIVWGGSLKKEPAHGCSCNSCGGLFSSQACKTTKCCDFIITGWTGLSTVWRSNILGLDIIKPSMRREFFTKYGQWFPQRAWDQHYQAFIDSEWSC